MRIFLLLVFVLSVCGVGTRGALVEDGDGERNLTMTSDLLDLFNLRRISDLWPEIVGEQVIENTNCTDDFKEYLDGHEQAKIWALKSK